MSRAAREQTVLPRISDFYLRLFQKSWLVFLIVETIIVIVVVGTFSLLTNIFDFTSVVLITILILILLESAVGFFFLRHVLRPTDLVTRTLAQMSGENSTLPAPDRNNPKTEKSGLNLILNTIYDINSHQNDQPAAASTDQELVNNLLATLPVGLIALNADRKIIATNSLAPVYVDNQKERQVQLDFSDINDPLSTWLDQVSASKISAEKIWTRIQNVAPGGTTERRIFDVIAHYKKNATSGIETILITVDRTTTYETDEASMDFIALAAHELRGPITVIRGYLDILEEQLSSTLTSEQHELIDRLNVSSKRLASYINNILNAARYDRRHLQLTLHETTVENIIDDIKDDMELRARTLNRTLIWQIPHNLPTVAADRSSISEVISNLIDNAIKYSHDGGQIEVNATTDNQFISVSVRDHGIGIPATVAQNLFNKFYRSYRSRGAVSGTGLGLYISRAIVESHGGHIGVESTEGQGSTFTFTLPIFTTVADQLASSNSNADLIRRGGNWIRNHSRVSE